MRVTDYIDPTGNSTLDPVIRTTTSSPTTTSPISDPSAPTDGTIGTKSPLEPETQAFIPKPSPTVLANDIFNRVTRAARAQRPSIITDGTLTILKSSPSINGRTFKRFIVSFDDGSDSNFAFARIWTKGYLTNGQLAAGNDLDGIPWVLQKTTNRTPITLDLEASSENMMIGVEMVNKSGEGLLELDQMQHVLTDTT